MLTYVTDRPTGSRVRFVPSASPVRENGVTKQITLCSSQISATFAHGRGHSEKDEVHSRTIIRDFMIYRCRKKEVEDDSRRGETCCRVVEKTRYVVSGDGATLAATASGR